MELAEIKGSFDMRNSDWDEHAALANAGEQLPIQQYDPTSECAEVAGHVEAAVLRKVAKGYPTGFVLAITANVFWFDDLEHAMVTGISRAATQGLGAFGAVWVLAGGRFFAFS